MTVNDREALEAEVLSAWEAGLPERATLAAWYRRSVDDLLETLRRTGGNMATVDTASINRFVAPLSAGDLNIASSNIRRLFEIAVEKGLRPDNPVKIKPRPKQVAVPIDLSEAQVATWLSHLEARARSVTDDARTILTSARTYATFELIYAAGLKVHEVRQLRRDDIISEPPSLNYPGVKGGRWVPITRSALRAVRWWEFLSFGYGDVRGDWLFHSATQPLAPITEQSFAAGIKTAISTAPLELRHLVSPEAVRYSLAKHLMAAGVEHTEMTYLFGYTQRYFFQRAFPSLFI